MTTMPTSRARLCHEAFLYRDDEEYAAVVGSFVSRALEADRPVLAAVSGSKAGALATALGERSRDVEFLDIADVGRNPSRIIPAFDAFREEHGGREVSFVDEPIWPGRTSAEIDEAIRHEALVNRALAGTPAYALCSYHVGALDDAVVAGVYRTHPVVQIDGRREVSESFTDPELVWRSLTPLSAVPALVPAVEFALSRLPAVREAVRAEAERGGLNEERSNDLVVATSEVVSNSIRHGGGTGVLRTWLEPDGVVCEVHDRGQITDPLAGRRRPEPAAEGGWGLWLVNQLCDLVQLHTGPGGTTVRLRMIR